LNRSPSGAVVVFAKAPRPGAVKTRLCPPWSLQQAADFYAAMLRDVLAATGEFARNLHLDAVVAVEPWALRGAVAGLAPANFRLIPQRGADLAARMTWAVRELAGSGARRILLRGSDSPTLDEPVLREAVAALADSDLVLQPDRDGGYGLVGLTGPIPGLFDHAMSSETVLADTLANAHSAGRTSCVLAPGFDIDRPDDLAALAAARSAGACSVCPRTLAYLDEAGLWPAPGAG